MDTIDEKTFFEDRDDRPKCKECEYVEACIKNVTAWNEAVEKYPNVCENCGGAGFVTWEENGAPHGEGYWPMPVSDICGCVDEGKCPRCASPLEEDEPKCSQCDWNEDMDDSVIPGEQPYCLYLMYQSYDFDPM